VPQNYAAAVSWYRKAAEQGNADAQDRLGSMYALGWASRRTMRQLWVGIESDDFGIGNKPQGFVDDVAMLAFG
jgi:TPR repeat protein